MADYSRAFDLDVVLHDNAVVRLRPIRPTDAGREERFFGRVSTESAYRRFFHFKQDLTSEEIRYLTTIDYDARMALIALQGGEMVGVARYDVIPGATHKSERIAELALLVQDDFQGRGLGKHLLQHLTAAARHHHISAFEAYVQPDNHRMFGLLRSCGYTLTRAPGADAYIVEFPIE
jgi:ribosomal protein S18 acetylase RimI-like enzyme